MRPPSFRGPTTSAGTLRAMGGVAVERSVRPLRQRGDVHYDDSTDAFAIV